MIIEAAAQELKFDIRITHPHRHTTNTTARTVEDVMNPLIEANAAAGRVLTCAKLDRPQPFGKTCAIVADWQLAYPCGRKVTGVVTARSGNGSTQTGWRGPPALPIADDEAKAIADAYTSGQSLSQCVNAFSRDIKTIRRVLAAQGVETRFQRSKPKDRLQAHYDAHEGRRLHGVAGRGDMPIRRRGKQA
jgi:hypothetical protein